jgi:hypothetical protein
MGMDGATTPAHTTSDRTKNIKENTEGVAEGMEITHPYFSRDG